MSDETTRGEIQLIGQAVRRRWPIPDEAREGIVKSLIADATESENERTRTAAAGVLERMDRQNMEQEKRDELGTAAKVVEHKHSGRIDVDVRKLSDAELDAIIAGGALPPGPGGA